MPASITVRAMEKLDCDSLLGLRKQYLLELHVLSKNTLANSAVCSLNDLYHYK